MKIIIIRTLSVLLFMTATWLTFTPTLAMAGTIASSTTSQYAVDLGKLTLIDPSIASLTNSGALTADQIATLPSSFLKQVVSASTMISLNNITGVSVSAHVPSRSNYYSSGTADIGFTYVYSRSTASLGSNPAVTVNARMSGGAVMVVIPNATRNASLGYLAFDNSSCPGLAEAILGGAPSGALTAAQIKLLPSDMQSAISGVEAAHRTDATFSDSVTYHCSDGIYYFTFNYAFGLAAGSNAIQITQAHSDWAGGAWMTVPAGGPPLTVPYGQSFPLNVTLQDWGCHNSNLYLHAGAAVPPSGAAGSVVQTAENNSIQWGGQGEGNQSHAYSDYLDISFGNFMAPKQTDHVTTLTIDSTAPVVTTALATSTTYKNSPQFQVYSRYDVFNAQTYNTTMGQWNVNLISNVSAPTSTLVASSGGTILTPTGGSTTVTAPNTNAIVLTSTVVPASGDSVTTNNITTTSNSLTGLPVRGTGAVTTYTIPAGTAPGLYVFDNYFGTTAYPAGGNSNVALSINITGEGPGVTQPGSTLVTVQAAAKPASEYRSWFSDSKSVNVQVKVPEKQ